ncbi:MAG: YoaK family protein [Nocardioidaceae bacterium]
MPGPSTSTRPHLVPVLLTFTAGAMDLTCFLSLGSVFASVMTGNMGLLGLAAGTSDGELALSAGLAFVDYAVGTTPRRTAPMMSRPSPRIRRFSVSRGVQCLWVRCCRHLTQSYRRRGIF